MMQIQKATDEYEAWIRRFIPVVEEDLEFKHGQMRSSAFSFLRATFYRWVQRVQDELGDAPEILAVGDLHAENFGTWRDAEGRLIWGINDFDEVSEMPYTNDLIRLATSIELAVEAGHLGIDIAAACDALVDGYRSNLESDGQPFVLEARHRRLRQAATGELRNPTVFWDKMSALPALGSGAEQMGLSALRENLPAGLEPDLRSRRAGLGSLGHPRYVALVDWRGGKIAREAKALAPSSVDWVGKRKSPFRIRYAEILAGAVRCADPFVVLHGTSEFESESLSRPSTTWVVRRLAPSCSRIELAMLPRERDEERLVQAMGFETGNVHRATPERLPDVKKHLEKQPAKWLRKSSRAMTEAVIEDYKAYRKQ